MSDDMFAGESRATETTSMELEAALLGATQGAPAVLMVDDDASVRSAHEQLLVRAGIAVTATASAADALGELRTASSRFDVVITDVVMPNMDGVALLREVRKHHADLPVVLITGHPEVDSAMAAVNSGGFRYLTKPVDPGELISTVHEAVGLRRLAHLKRVALELLHAAPHLLGDRASLEGHFDQARAGLWVAFQPIVNWRTRELLGYEALVRSSSSVISNPALLFDTAERLGRVTELGRAIRSLVADAFVSAPEGAVIFVNLHAIDLLDDELYDRQLPLAKYANRIVLEITERSSMEHIADIANRIVALRVLGYRIAVDDLGAGYAGLSSFNLLEPDVAKLDMSLIRDIDKSRRKQSLVRSMISVCTRELGVEVVCEGVETEQERDALMRLGATLLQGYLFGRPTRTFERFTVNSQMLPMADGVVARNLRAKGR